eukprot:13438914-Alexandrium_andersonii.AAC.1
MPVDLMRVPVSVVHSGCPRRLSESFLAPMWSRRANAAWRVLRNWSPHPLSPCARIPEADR